MTEGSSMKGSSSNGHCSSGFRLFGVQIGGDEDDRGGVVSAIRKSKSCENLQACGSEPAAAMPEGYLSDGLVHMTSKSNDRKKGKPWSEEEHLSFLAGLNRLGKGDWKGISTNFVPTRNPTQVASHAQKYFIRKAASEKRRRRTSVFDIPLNDVQPDVVNRRTSNSKPVSSWYVPTKRFNINGTNMEEQKKGQSLLPSTIPVSERPPLSPRRRGISELHSMAYMPRVSSFSHPSIAWVPVVNYPYITNLQEPFAKCRRFMPENAATPTQSTSSRAAADRAHTKEELNLSIRKMAL